MMQHKDLKSLHKRWNILLNPYCCLQEENKPDDKCATNFFPKEVKSTLQRLSIIRSKLETLHIGNKMWNYPLFILYNILPKEITSISFTTWILNSNKCQPTI